MLACSGKKSQVVRHCCDGYRETSTKKLLQQMKYSKTLEAATILEMCPHFGGSTCKSPFGNCVQSRDLHCPFSEGLLRKHPE